MTKKTAGQLGKFLVIGVGNTAVDFIVLNILLLVMPLHISALFGVFKAISFGIASLNSYIWNKYWAFRNDRPYLSKSKERNSFILVSLGGLCINTAASSFVFALLVQANPMISHIFAGNIGGLFGTAFGLVWNFIAYKYFVFRSTQTA
ncbi:MAG: putative rane protein [Candidatus Kaiserbacteria bacterium]|nr:putative rane protein [Candidatus Kaiserbacteria bacterium]